VNAISDEHQSLAPIAWAGTFGPRLDRDGCIFRLWARADAKIELVIESADSPRTIPMSLAPSGMFEARVDGAGAGTRYWFKMNGDGPFPDPASRYQPLGVHGPSQVLGPGKFSWAEDYFELPSLTELVIYELHVGTFTPAGTFLAVIEKLDDLRTLGVNTIELMPIAQFPGERNWGYDGVSLYAPAYSYGTPDDLRTLVREAHRRGIAVFLDVVYNHLGPDGAYHSMFAPQFYSGKHHTPWGDGLNFDGEDRDKVRNYFIESALEWVYEYHIDGLRCDATDTIQDDSKPHFLTELTVRVHAAARGTGRRVFLIAEDARNERKVVMPPEKDGHGFDAVWSDDFHHHMRHRLAGDSDGYYRDFDGTAEHIAETIQNGWSFTGQFTQHWNSTRGTTPKGLSLQSRLFCIQNHDQIGNRAFGERLSKQIDQATFHAASALLLLSPEIPLIFMGQEWSAPEPFLFFTDHSEELGHLVTEGRRKEFAHFADFSDESRRDSIPDPQAKETFLQSKLDWAKRSEPEHAASLEWYQRLLRIRKTVVKNGEFLSCRALSDKVIAVEWGSEGGRLTAVVVLEGATCASDAEWRQWRLLLSSEDVRFAAYPEPVDWNSGTGELRFHRAGAVFLASGDLMFDLESKPE
jgi:maltooligosyltrehalose trehalohydrolase